jgi:hypothetical protein
MISSAGVGVAIGLLKRLREDGGELALCGLTDRVEMVFRLCSLIAGDGVTGVFHCWPDIPAAVAGLKKR